MEKPFTKLIYMAHPVAGDVAANIASAKKWLRRLQDMYPAHDFIAPWITDVEIYDDSKPIYREAGLQRCERVIARCDALVLVGDRISEGMKREWALALELHHEIYRARDFESCKPMQPYY